MYVDFYKTLVHIRGMNIGYGYDRAPEALTDLGAERVYIDTAGTGRQERANMLANGSMRPGDVLVMLAASDLGRGPEVRKIRKAIEAKGVKIETPAKSTPYNRPGRPRRFAPDPSQDKQIEALYRSYLTMAHVLARASDIMGRKVERHQLVYRYKKRWPE